MAKFIPIDKMKKLREAARNGDERAKKILAMQMGGTEDFSSHLDDYFRPAPAANVQETSTGAAAAKPMNSKLAEFLKFNGVEEGNPDYDSYVEDFYKENPDEPREIAKEEEKCPLDTLIADEIEAIQGYNNIIMKFMAEESEDATLIKGILVDLEEIKRDEVEHLDKLRRLKASMHKKHEEHIDLGGK